MIFFLINTINCTVIALRFAQQKMLLSTSHSSTTQEVTCQISASMYEVYRTLSSTPTQPPITCTSRVTELLCFLGLSTYRTTLEGSQQLTYPELSHRQAAALHRTPLQQNLHGSCQGEGLEGSHPQQLLLLPCSTTHLPEAAERFSLQP